MVRQIRLARQIRVVKQIRVGTLTQVGSTTTAGRVTLVVLVCIININPQQKQHSPNTIPKVALRSHYRILHSKVISRTTNNRTTSKTTRPHTQIIHNLATILLKRTTIHQICTITIRHNRWVIQTNTG